MGTIDCPKKYLLDSMISKEAGDFQGKISEETKGIWHIAQYNMLRFLECFERIVCGLDALLVELCMENAQYFLHIPQQLSEVLRSFAFDG